MGQKEDVLGYMMDNGSITGMDAVVELGVMKLSNRIGELEDDGHRIGRKWEAAKNRKGKKTRFVRYYLEER